VYKESAVDVLLGWSLRPHTLVASGLRHHAQVARK
jgi:hypothetical protein